MCAFEPHRHDTYAIGLTTAGVQIFRYRGSRRICLPGQLHVLHPDETHDGAAGTDDGFGYRILYIAPELVRDALAGRALPFVADPIQEPTPAARPIASLLADIDEPISELSSAEIAAAVADGLLSLSGQTNFGRATVDIRAVELVRDYLVAHASEQTPASRKDRGHRSLHDRSPVPMGVRDEPRPIPDAAPPGAGTGRDRERPITRASRRRGRLRRPKPHDAPVQANLRPDARPLDGSHSRLLA